jgi:hypothetical protein
LTAARTNHERTANSHRIFAEKDDLETIPTGGLLVSTSYVRNGFQPSASSARSAITAIQRIKNYLGHPAHF